MQNLTTKFLIVAGTLAAVPAFAVSDNAAAAMDTGSTILDTAATFLPWPWNVAAIAVSGILAFFGGKKAVAIIKAKKVIDVAGDGLNDQEKK